MDEKVVNKTLEELKKIFTDEELEFIVKNHKSSDPEIIKQLADIYYRTGYLNKMFSKDSYFNSEEYLLEMAKKGPEQKAVAQSLLGRIIDNEGYWDVPDYRDPWLEYNILHDNTTLNDYRLSGEDWFICGENKYRYKVPAESAMNDPNVDSVMSFDRDKQVVSITGNNYTLNLPFDTVYAMLQKCRELGMPEPPAADYKLMKK